MLRKGRLFRALYVIYTLQLQCGHASGVKRNRAWLGAAQASPVSLHFRSQHTSVKRSYSTLLCISSVGHTVTGKKKHTGCFPVCNQDGVARSSRSCTVAGAARERIDD